MLGYSERVVSQSTDSIDTLNKFCVQQVGSLGIRIGHPRPGKIISTDDALNLAAWLVAIADPTGEQFPKVLDAVHNT
jgi:hypothetical protein